MSEYTAVVSGSFNHIGLPRIIGVVSLLEDAGFRVLAPHFRTVDMSDTSFPVLDTDDRSKSPRELERAYLQAIGEASLHVIVNPVGGRIGRSAAAEYAYAGIHGTARMVTTASALESQGHPPIWFAGVSREEEQALDRLPWFMSGLCGSFSFVEHMIEKAEPLPADHADYNTLTGIYEKLLADLSDTPLQTASVQ